MAIHDAELQVANRRAAARLRRTPVATAARYDRRIGRIVIDLSSGLEVAFRANDAQGLEHAKPSELSKIEISPSGLGIHFPLLDADLYLPALLEGFLGSRRWMAAQMGKAGGAVSTKAKAAASRRNGRLGGRPAILRAVAEGIASGKGRPAKEVLDRLEAKYAAKVNQRRGR
jgi:hypothetical protein